METPSLYCYYNGKNVLQMFFVTVSQETIHSSSTVIPTPKTANMTHTYIAILFYCTVIGIGIVERHFNIPHY